VQWFVNSVNLVASNTTEDNHQPSLQINAIELGSFRQGEGDCQVLPPRSELANNQFFLPMAKVSIGPHGYYDCLLVPVSSFVGLPTGFCKIHSFADIQVAGGISTANIKC
jgi:hypothetical protein